MRLQRWAQQSACDWLTHSHTLSLSGFYPVSALPANPGGSSQQISLLWNELHKSSSTFMRTTPPLRWLPDPRLSSITLLCKSCVSWIAARHGVTGEQDHIPSPSTGRGKKAIKSVTHCIMQSKATIATGEMLWDCFCPHSQSGRREEKIG